MMQYRNFGQILHFFFHSHPPILLPLIYNLPNQPVQISPDFNIAQLQFHQGKIFVNHLVKLLPHLFVDPVVFEIQVRKALVLPQCFCEHKAALRSEPVPAQNQRPQHIVLKQTLRNRNSNLAPVLAQLVVAQIHGDQKTVREEGVCQRQSALPPHVVSVQVAAFDLLVVLEPPPQRFPDHVVQVVPLEI